ncbi:hypothetical protein [Paenibacillus sp. FSL H8-0034]|uniref:hypothetical protein n=1 Tax=Paenibacillus sp. FSL H8-0034 TaxID=2954671 RepID=UPI0030FB6139
MANPKRAVNKERSGQMIPEKRQRSPLFPYFYRKITYKMNKNTETTAIVGIFGRAVGLIRRTSKDLKLSASEVCCL